MNEEDVEINAFDVESLVNMMIKVSVEWSVP